MTTLPLSTPIQFHLVLGKAKSKKKKKKRTTEKFHREAWYSKRCNLVGVTGEIMPVLAMFKLGADCKAQS